MKSIKKIDIVLFSPWSGDKNDKRKLRHYNLIKSMEEQKNIRICLVVENNSLHFQYGQLDKLNSCIIYVPAFDVSSGENKRIKRLVSMLIYPLSSILLFISNSSIRKASGYWVSSPHPGATIVGIFISFFKRNLLYEIRDPWPELPIKTGLLKKDSIISKIFKKIDTVAQGRSKKILLTSVSYKKYLKEKNKQKSIIIANTISKNNIKYYSHNYQKGNALHLVFAGGCARAFRMEIVFEAISLAIKEKKGLKIIFELYIDKTEQERFKIIVDNLGISKNIIFHNKVAYEKMLNAIKQSDYYILHITDNDVFREDINSNKLLDAFTCLKPVIFAANTQLNHIKQSEGGLCCVPDSAHGLAFTIIAASEISSIKYKKMIKNMEEYVLQNLIIEPKAETIYKLFMD